MKYMLQVWLPDGVVDALPPAEKEKLDRDCLAHDNDVKERGYLVDAQALYGPEMAVSIRHRGGTVSVTDGPFVETREHFGGYIVVDVRDLNEAIRIAGEMPIGRYGGIEIRPLFDLSAHVEAYDAKAS